MDNYPFYRILHSPLSAEQLGPLDARCGMVQICSPLKPAEYERVGQFMWNYPDVMLRIFGSFDQECHLHFLRFFPFLRSFELAVFNLESLEGIEHLSDKLQYFGLSQTRSKNFSLRFLARFQSLKELFLEGHKKDFEVVGELQSLERLTLRSITLKDLSVLKPLHRLYWLAIKLGGTTNLELLPEIGSLRYLELWMIRGLSKLEVVNRIATLQYLFLQALKQVSILPSFNALEHLRRVHLETMKSLSDLGPVSVAPNLEELLVLDMRQLQPEAFLPFVGHPQLKRVLVALGSLRKNAAVSSLLPLPTLAYEKSDFQFRTIESHHPGHFPSLGSVA